MPALSIKIFRSNEKPIQLESGSIDGELQGVYLLEKGMQSGEPSVFLKTVTPEKEIIYAQIPASFIEYLFRVIEGAKANWQENPL